VPATALALLVLVAGAFLVTPRAEAGAEILREAYAPSTWDNAFANVWVNQMVAQSFLARTSFLLTHLELYVFDQPDNQGPDILQVFIAGDAGNAPGAILASTARQGQQNWTWVAFGFYPWVSLTAGQRYWIVAESSNPRPKGYEWAMNAVGGYATGEAQWFDSSAGSWVNATGSDLFFQVFGISGPSIALDMDPPIRTADPGTILSMALWFNNSGNDLAGTVWIDLDLEAGLTYVSDDATASGGSLIAPLRWRFTDVAPAPHRLTVWLRLEPDPGYFDGQSLEAWGFLNYTDASGAPQTGSTDLATVTVLVPVVRGQVVPTPAHVAPDETFNMTVSFYNLGSGRSAWLWANASVVARLTILADDAGSAGGTAVGPNAWRFSNVTGQVYAFNITVRADAIASPGDRLLLIVNLTYTDGAARLFGVRTLVGTASIHGPSMVVEGSNTLSAVRPDEVISVILHANNTGDEVATRAWLNVTIPTEVVFLDSFPLVAVPAGNRLDYVMSNVAPGIYAVTVRMRVRGDAPPTTLLETSATLEVTNASGASLRPSSVIAAAVVVTPRFSLTLSTSARRIAPGDVVDLILGLSNSGNEPAARVWLNLTLPDKTLLVNSTMPWASTNGTSYGWLLTSVGPGSQTLSVRLEASARLADGDVLVARASLSFERGDGVVLNASNTTALLEGVVNLAEGLELLFLWAAILVAVLLLFLLLGYWDVLPRRRGAIDDVFLLHNSGILICHYSTSLRPDVDSDIASGMLMAVRNFVADALRTKNGTLDQMKYGDHRIHIAHGVHSILVVFARGRSGRNLDLRMQEVLRNIEMAYADILESWSGRTEEFKGVEEHLLRLVNA
jgi:hypothetical protein